MQTFLPLRSFVDSAKCLDRQRLGKQRVECFQLLKLMCNPDDTAWRNHPCFKMWDGYDFSLISYGLAICEEWMIRGYQDTIADKLTHILMMFPPYGNAQNPPWLGDESFHSSHRSALLYKNYDWYKQFGWAEEPAIPEIDKRGNIKLPYIWPV